ncbi:hypothetical protein TNCV_2371211 [Trichonephila clavipes]|nr:hypothetical protein TNCV_2371211 [Trichonephila clavipes]
MSFSQAPSYGSRRHRGTEGVPVPEWRPMKELARNRLTCWTKPSNCDANPSSVDAVTNNGPTRPIAPTSLHPSPRIHVDCAHDYDNLFSHIMSHNIIYQSITQHSVSDRNIQSRLQQSGMSARRPLLRLSLTANRSRSTVNGVMNGGHG